MIITNRSKAAVKENISCISSMRWLALSVICTVRLAIICAMAACTSCVHDGTRVPSSDWRKVELDLTQVDSDGLRGPPDGKVALAYEFCVPNTDQCKALVAAIDSSVQFMPGASGRIGASETECLCIGSTHQKDFKLVLEKLAKLPFVSRVIRCDFE